MHTGTMEKIANEPWERKRISFFEGYRAAKALETEDFTVLLGMELRFLENDNDYLVYGFNEDFAIRIPTSTGLSALRTSDR